MLLPVTFLLINYLSLVSAQVNSRLKCGVYSASNTASATTNYVLCDIPNVCPGVQLVIGDCSSSCTGDQYIRLFNADNTIQLAGNDDGACESPLGLCSLLEYTYSGPSCTSMVLRQGCYDNGDCGGNVKVNYIYTSAPTYAPSAVPTAVPSWTTPTSFPSSSVVLGANDVSCLPYTASRTDRTRINYAICNFQVCPGTVLTIGDCTNSCVGDQFIRLFDSSNNLVMYDDDGCNADPYSRCSQLTYVYSNGVCQTFSLHQGCFGDETCGGTMRIVRTTTPSPTVVPTAIPTTKPSVQPTSKPSADPTSFPSARPSSEPTATPSAIPTSFPTARPSSTPTTPPTARPTSLPTFVPTQQPLTGFATTDINNITPVTQTIWYKSKYVGVVYTIYDCTFNLADDAACQAAYPTARIVTLDDADGMPVKFAYVKQFRAPTSLPTGTPANSPTFVPTSTLPSTLTLDGKTLNFFSNSNMPYLNSALGNLNQYITGVWTYFNSKNPAVSVLLPYASSHYYLYGDNTNTAWWVYGINSDYRLNQEYLVVEFDTDRYITSIEAWNYDVNPNPVSWADLTPACGTRVGNTINNIVFTSSPQWISIQGTANFLGSLTVNRSCKTLILYRNIGSGGSSRVENIIIK